LAFFESNDDEGCARKERGEPKLPSMFIAAPLLN
jgi:hypothetical protein